MQGARVILGLPCTPRVEHFPSRRPGEHNTALMGILSWIGHPGAGTVHFGVMDAQVYSRLEDSGRNRRYGTLFAVLEGNNDVA